MEIEKIIEKYVKKKFKNIEIDPTKNFREIGVDSLEVVDLVLTIEKKAGIEFSDDELSELKTLDDLKKLCKQKQ